MISVFDLFSIGVGPSSSHTVGPMRSARDFMLHLESRLDDIKRVTATLYGSLAFTGQGHSTDRAILVGLEGYAPESVDPDIIEPRMQSIIATHQIKLLNKRIIPFHFNEDLIFNYKETFDFHTNAMRFIAYDQHNHVIAEEVYFSVGGGFIVKQSAVHTQEKQKSDVPYPFQIAADLLEYCKRDGVSIQDIVMANEKAWRSEADIRKGILNIAKAMEQCLVRGCNSTEKELPGKLHVRRRAPALYNKLLAKGKPGPQHVDVMNWLNAYALAVNEENAAGGRVVTAPTNGAAGIVPAVLEYYKQFCPDASDDGIINYLLTAGAIGILYKQNASISGAEMGCQGEVGVACSMAAGGLAAALGGSVAHVENAAEIGMEHNLGLTCDPIAGLVQVPCIERNAMGAVKAVNAARLALAEEGKHLVSLDMVINTMREIGTNMMTIYKETSKGGLAVNVPEC